MVVEMIPEMVTIREASERSGLSYYTIRRLCLTDKIVHIKTGTKFLVNWNKFLEYLNGGKE